MRNLKFRAWDEKNQRMITEIGLFDLSDADEKLSIQALEECPIMQYTGLKDKNGVEIYEDDILCVQYNNIGNIKVNFENGMFNCRKFKLAECVVMGNIHENKSLSYKEYNCY